MDVADVRRIGHDTVLDFGNGDVLVLEDMRNLQLSANDFLFA